MNRTTILVLVALASIGPAYAQKPAPPPSKWPWGDTDPFKANAEAKAARAPPRAAEPSANAPTHRYLKQASGLAVVIVWKDSASHSRGLDYISRGMIKTQPAMIDALIACIVPNGAEVVMDSVGMFSHDITVISGKHAGCSGNISVTDITS